MKDCHVLIIGAGLGGLTAALALQRSGFKVSVFEQARELKEIGAGVVIAPNAMHALNFLGVGPRVADEAGEATSYGVRAHATGDVLKRGPTARTLVETYGASFHHCHRADLHATLAEAVVAHDPDCVQLGHAFESLLQDPTGVTARFANGSTWRGDALIGCDGHASRVRSAVFGDEPVEYTGQVAFRALTPIDSVPDALMEISYGLFIGPGRLLLHYPLRRGTIMNVIGIARQPIWQQEGWTIPATVSEFHDLYQDFHPAILRLIDQLPPEHLFKWGLRDREPLQTWTSGRVGVLGDAAHPMTPFLGQGAAIAIEDGTILGRAFALADTVEQALTLFEAARKDRANGVQLASREQADALQGIVPQGANPGRDAEARGLFRYNPATVAL